MDLLTTIITSKRRRSDAAKKLLPLDQMRALAKQARVNAQPHRLVEALSDESRINIIAEFKRRSPSKGEINYSADPAQMGRLYESAGAAAVSVLTEEDFFDGSLEDLRAVRQAISLPILRKDFVFEEYQIYEAAAVGADALLLIVAVLDDETLARLRRISEDELEMDALVEVHTREELDRALRTGAHIIGVNNRDLRTFSVSIETSAQLARAVPDDLILVSESGLNPEEVRKLMVVGYKGFLVGEALMRADDPGQALRSFLLEPERVQGPANMALKSAVKIKICGITNVEDARAAVEAGADMLGFNFYRASPRFIEPKNARAIINRLRSETTFSNREVAMVGVFVDESSPESVARTAEEAGVDAVQLHGDDSFAFCEVVKTLLPDCLLIKVLRVDEKFQPAEAKQYAADAIMLDAFHSELRGGTGKTVDWKIARRMAEAVPHFFLAGGLAPENVAAAIEAVRPYGVDACTSLESSPGKKNASRMKEFVCAAQTG